MTKITLLSNLFQVLQTRFELVRLAPTDFKAVVYTVPPPEDELLYHEKKGMQQIIITVIHCTVNNDYKVNKEKI